ncbi:MAG: sigma-70 family RNA polymerase sigma factor [Oscillospiraceae bacterium]|nr:sigma-70 family RNA polymerase sigma factor [Oscillospiraceae bacterium]
MKYQKIKDLKTKCDVDNLWLKYDENRTIENRNELIEHYLYLLYKPVKSIYPLCRSSQETSDIFQSAVIGLIEAVEYYSKDKNTSFKTFSRWRIHGSIIDYLRKSSMINLPYKIRKKINSDRLKAESENIYFENPYNIISLDSLNDSSENHGFQNAGNIIDSLQADIYDDENSTENKIEDKIMLENIYKALKNLPFDEYATIIQYYFLDKTLEEIAVKFKMTRSGVWQIRKRAVNNIRKMINA